MSKEAIYNEAIRQCAKAIGMSEKTLASMVSKVTDEPEKLSIESVK